MTITKVKLESFTAFDNLEVQLSSGINVFVGANGTGKTHLLKVCYAACVVSKTGESFTEKLLRVFLPSGRALERLIKRQGVGADATVEISRGGINLLAAFPNRKKGSSSASIQRSHDWTKTPIESVYIPVKEMLSNAPGFLSLYAAREVHFEEVYVDILQRAYLPALRNPEDSSHKGLLSTLQKAMGGTVIVKGEEFFLHNRQGNLEFSLLAEGMRKIGLLWLLIKNGTLSPGSVLFWDEPETNLNPSLYGTLMQVLLQLQRSGVQIFIATHDYVILKELDLLKEEKDDVVFHSLYRDETNQITCHTTDKYLHIHLNAIMETFNSLYDREIKRSLGGLV